MLYFFLCLALFCLSKLVLDLNTMKEFLDVEPEQNDKTMHWIKLYFSDLVICVPCIFI